MHVHYKLIHVTSSDCRYFTILKNLTNYLFSMTKMSSFGKATVSPNAFNVSRNPRHFLQKFKLHFLVYKQSPKSILSDQLQLLLSFVSVNFFASKCERCENFLRFSGRDKRFKNSNTQIYVILNLRLCLNLQLNQNELRIII